MNVKVVSMLVLSTVIYGARVDAVPILIGSASFNQASGLYTYSYLVDNRLGPAPIDEVGILIHSSQQDQSLVPLEHTEPPGWRFLTATSGNSAFPPLMEFGTFWQWRDADAGMVPVPVGSTLGGFSFTTNLPPTARTNNNFFLTSYTFDGGPSSQLGNIVEFGHIVAPDFSSIGPIPEPSTLAFAAIGTLFMAGYLWWQRFRTYLSSLSVLPRDGDIQGA
jgi:hypothetical protein